MKVKEVIEKLKNFNQDADFIVACDEELNTLYSGFEIAVLTDSEEENSVEEQVVIYGLSGSELDE